MGITRYGNQTGEHPEIDKKPQRPDEDLKGVASSLKNNNDKSADEGVRLKDDDKETKNVELECKNNNDESADEKLRFKDNDAKSGDVDLNLKNGDENPKNFESKIKKNKGPTEELHIEIEKEAQKASGTSGVVGRMKNKFTKKYHTPVFDESKTMEYKGFTKEIKQMPDWGEYKKGYGKAYKKVIIAAIPGIAFFVFVSIMNLVFHIKIINIPIAFSLLTWLINVWYTASLAAIPITLFIRYHSFRRLKNNYILFKKKEIVLYRETLNEMIDKEHIVLSEVCTIKFITPLYQETEGYFKIRGVVEVKECYNGKAKKKELRESVNIPKIFKGLEIIHEYAPDPIYNPDGKMFVWTKRRKDEKLFEWGFSDSKDREKGKDTKCQKKKRWWSK